MKRPHPIAKEHILEGLPWALHHKTTHTIGPSTLKREMKGNLQASTPTKAGSTLKNQEFNAGRMSCLPFSNATGALGFPSGG